MHKDCERILLTEEQLKARVTEVAKQVDGDYQGKRPLVVGILKGSIIFYADFIRCLTIPIELDFMAVSSYGAGTESSGKLKIKKDLDRDIAGRDVIIVEDIIDSGFTLSNLKRMLIESAAPKPLKSLRFWISSRAAPWPSSPITIALPSRTSS